MQHAYYAERLIRAFGLTPDAAAPIIASLPADSDVRDYCGLLYDRLCDVTGEELPWGVLTGVRPIRFIRNNRDDISHYRVSPEKLALADEIIAAQKSLLPAPKRHFHLYVGIPFCPSRCRYCSFVSHSVEKAARLIPRYLELLFEELSVLGD